MTELLERAIAKVKALTEEEQDTIAALVLDEIEDEARWDEAFAHSQDTWQDWRKRRLRRIAPGEHKSWIQMQCEVTDHGAVRRTLAKLPSQVRKQARDAYRRFQQDPTHRSLGFKQVHTTLPIYAVRVGKGYRAVGQRTGNDIVWFWIGSHAEYDKLLSQF